jgi:hypothetical protein
VQPGLQALQQTYDTLGIKVDNAATKALLLQSTILTKNPELMAGVGALAGQFDALNTLGMLNASTFGDMETLGLQMYARLQGATAAAGGSTKDALLPMQQYLHEAEKAAKDLGVPLDDNTQMLVDQSKELGIWREPGKTPFDAATEAVDTLVTRMSDLIDVLTGKNGINAAANNLVNTIGQIPQNPFQNWKVPPAATGGDPAGYAAKGGLVTTSGIQYLAGGGNVLAFTPRGTDTVPAMLTPGEMVLSRRDATAYRQGDGDVVVETNLVVDGEVLARLVERHQDVTIRRRRKLRAA